MKYILTLREWTLGGEPIEEDYKEFGTKDEVARYIVNTRWFTKKNFDSEHFKGKVIRSEDCWKKRPYLLKRAKARELIKTMEDLQKTKDYEMLLWSTGYDWYEVEDDYDAWGKYFMDESLYEALYDPLTGLSYESTIGHVPGYRD